MTAVASTTKTQEAVDRFYMQHGPCCAGCDWWHHYGSVLGECRRSAPVSAEQRYSMARMDRLTFLTLDESAGHIVTNREHHCGDFRDGFDWPSLPPHYLRRIGWDGEAPTAREGIAMTDDDLKELAYSAHEEAMSFGLSHDTFLRYFKTIRNRMQAHGGDGSPARQGAEPDGQDLNPDLSASASPATKEQQ